MNAFPRSAACGVAAITLVAAMISTSAAGFLPAFTGHTVMAPPATFAPGDYLAVSFAVYQTEDDNWTDDWAACGIDPTYFRALGPSGGDQGSDAPYVYFFQIVGDFQGAAPNIEHSVDRIRMSALGSRSMGYVRGADVPVGDPPPIEFPTCFAFLDGDALVRQGHYGLGGSGGSPPENIPEDGLTVVGVDLNGQPCPFGEWLGVGNALPHSASASDARAEFSWYELSTGGMLSSVFFFTSDEPPGGFAAGELIGTATHMDTATTSTPPMIMPFMTQGLLPAPVPEPGVLVTIAAGILTVLALRAGRRGSRPG
ncbi:MAG: hypothetical protein JW809_08325 [Pirellulales bacterium]|nr:hypothetical protein [Pirellulales bacterium]